MSTVGVCCGLAACFVVTSLTKGEKANDRSARAARGIDRIIGVAHWHTACASTVVLEVVLNRIAVKCSSVHTVQYSNGARNSSTRTVCTTS